MGYVARELLRNCRQRILELERQLDDETLPEWRRHELEAQLRAERAILVDRERDVGADVG